VAVFEFNAAPLWRALNRAAKRGVRVRLVTNADTSLAPAKGFRMDIRVLRGRRPRSGIMHHKFAIFDQLRVATGSYNWSRGAAHANHENVLIEDDRAVVRAYRRHFNDLWTQARVRR
jgi:phosphatidylserine/phosphatidylglycerophosphate/cardiolipin synthase-like enzyme